jgi:hypothetical protein
VTIAAYYAEYAIDGRAVVQGEPWAPERWIVRLDDGYVHCQSNDGKVIDLDPQMDVQVLQRFRALGGRPRKQAVQ